MSTFVFFAILVAALALRIWASVEYFKFLDENPAIQKKLEDQMRRHSYAYV